MLTPTPPWCVQIVNMINARVSLQRIQKFMECDEMQGQGDKEEAGLPAGTAILVRGPAFRWEPQGEPVLKDLDVQVGGWVGGVQRSAVLESCTGELRGAWMAL